MKKKKQRKVWNYLPQAPKFEKYEKERILDRVRKIVQQLPKASKIVSRIDMRGNKIYLYNLVEPFRPEGAVFIKPLIDDKYIECIYARITLHDAQCNDCSVDWQRHNNQWFSLHEGTLENCLDDIEKDDCWFRGE